jgi:hypothetical protein
VLLLGIAQGARVALLRGFVFDAPRGIAQRERSQQRVCK